MKATFYAGENDQGKRLDVIMRKLYRNVPLSAISAAMRKSQISVNGNPMPGNHRLSKGSTIVCHAPFAQEFHLGELFAPKKPLSPEKIRIISQYPDFLVVQKPRGVDLFGDFLGQLRATLPKTKDLSFLPSPVHQLDKDTAGLVLISRNIQGARTLSSLFQKRKIRKDYIGIARGYLHKPVIWKDRLQRNPHQSMIRVHPEGKTAETAARPLLQWKKGTEQFTLIHYVLHTGRTHQIRVQSAAHAFPLAGDKKYQGGHGAYFLLAWRLQFIYGGNSYQFTAIVTKEDRRMLQMMGGKHLVLPGE